MCVHLEAVLAVHHGVRDEALSALEMGEGFHGPPRLQVARHSHRRPHLQSVTHTLLRNATAAQGRVFRLRNIQGLYYYHKCEKSLF